MSLIFAKIRSELPKKVLILERTKTIEDEDLIHSEWAGLSDDYQKTEKDGVWHEQAIVSMVNAIMHHRRVVFIMTRDSFRTLLRTDKNWKRPIGMKNDAWSKFLFMANNSGIIRCLQAPQGREAGVYEVVYEPLIKTLVVDVEKQRKECLDYVSGKSNISAQKQGKDQNGFPLISEDLGSGDRKGDDKRDRKGDANLNLNPNLNENVSRRDDYDNSVLFWKEAEFLEPQISTALIDAADRTADSDLWLRNTLTATTFQLSSSPDVSDCIGTHFTSPLRPDLDKIPGSVLHEKPNDLRKSFDYRRQVQLMITAAYDKAAALLSRPSSKQSPTERLDEALLPLVSMGIPLHESFVETVLLKCFGAKPAPAVEPVVTMIRRAHSVLVWESIHRHELIVSKFPHPDKKVHKMYAPLVTRKPKGAEVLDV